MKPHAHDAHGHGHEPPQARASAHVTTHGTHAHAHGGHHHVHAFGLGAALNLALVVVEAVYGLAAHSMALLADAGHNLGDVLGIVLAGLAALLARRKPTKQHTYGYRRLTVLAALANAILLLVATGAMAWESARRLHSPLPVQTNTVVLVALAGTLINLLSASLFFRGRQRDLNVRGAFVHLMGDAAVGVGVVVASAVMRQTGWLWLDPLTGIVISVLILVSASSLLRQSLDLALDAVPAGIDIDAVRAYLEALPRVREVHDLHVWAMSTTEAALTAHLVMPRSACDASFLAGACEELGRRFGIDHATLQVDPDDAPGPCRLAAHSS
jgi:cobalt-zinc-cadmium efflux system protein